MAESSKSAEPVESTPVVQPSVAHLAKDDVELLLGMVWQMATFLHDPLRFAESVRQQWNPLPEGWGDVLELLTRDPVLGGKENDWHWLYDFFGNPVPPPSETAGKAFAPAAAEASETVGTSVQEVRDRIAKIREFDAAISSYTEERLSLDQLAVELRLLEISPIYSTFEAAASSYLANAGPGPEEAAYPSLSSDRLVIQQYSSLLERCWPSTKWTFFLAALISMRDQSIATPRARSGALRLIAEDLDFWSLSSDQLEKLLNEFEDDLAEIDPTGLHHRAAYQEMKDAALDSRWFDVMTLRASIEPPLWKPGEDEKQALAYYKSRFKALLLHLRNGKPLRRPRLMDLCARFNLPVVPLHGDPNAIPLGIYAGALADSLAREDLAYACLIKLGFGMELGTVFGPIYAEQEDRLDLIEVAGSGVRDGERVLLILGARYPASGSTPELQMSRFWTMSQKHAVFPVFSDFVWPPGLADKLDFTVRLGEGTPPEITDEWTRVLKNDAVEIVKSSEDKRRVIVQPKDLDDAVAQFLSLPRPAKPPV